MASKFIERNGEVYRVLHQGDDACWTISFDGPERSFCIALEEMQNLQRIQAPLNFVPEDGNLSSSCAEAACNHSAAIGTWFDCCHGSSAWNEAKRRNRAMIHILVVEDDAKRNQLVCTYLSGCGFEAKGTLRQTSTANESEQF